MTCQNNPLHLFTNIYHVYCPVPVPVAAQSKAHVYGSSPAEIVRSNPTGDMDVCLL